MTLLLLFLLISSLFFSGVSNWLPLSLPVSLCQEALHREQMLEQKLATLQRLLANTQEASESSWQVGNTIIMLWSCTVTQRGTNVMMHPPAVFTLSGSLVSLFSNIMAHKYMLLFLLRLFLLITEWTHDGFPALAVFPFVTHITRCILEALYCISHNLPVYWSHCSHFQHIVIVFWFPTSDSDPPYAPYIHSNVLYTFLLYCFDHIMWKLYVQVVITTENFVVCRAECISIV